MEFLSAEQNDQFTAANQRFGLGAADFSAQLSTAEFAALPQTRVMASTGKSDFPSHVVAVGSIQELRALVGNNDTPGATPLLGQEPHYPEPLSDAELAGFKGLATTSLKPEISAELADRVTKAAEAYVLGDPAKVESYVEAINALKFPGRVAVFSGDTLEIPAGTTHVLTGDDPVVLNYGHISIAPGGSLRIETEFFINAQMFTHTPALQAMDGALGDSPAAIYITGAPWTEPAAIGAVGDPAPAQTGTGTNGASHYDGGSCKNVCDTQPTNGPTGNNGGTGKTGTPGAPGRPSPAGPVRLGILTQPLTVYLGGSNGQKGGQGGPGAPGGAGGSPGSAATGCNNSVSQGPQGKGGQGGVGGVGGPGGVSGYVSIYYTWTGAGQGVSVTVATVDGGEGGDPGVAGASASGDLGPGSQGGRGTQGAVPQFALYNEA